ncbi:hypothetical protein P3T76_009717 [Phytophthora citrophthora]|uniref:Uncharacterized protein n=1 Tax=Phytophthora citrophthora TaxID=4793 RepID=A0AAD9LIT0_9STRA|nr:hypothetical protein P3T76_009717 [Phytophthora citrophthora]
MHNLHENRTERCTTDAMGWATRNEHLDIVEWLHENQTEGCTTSRAAKTSRGYMTTEEYTVVAMEKACYQVVNGLNTIESITNRQQIYLFCVEHRGDSVWFVARVYRFMISRMSFSASTSSSERIPSSKLVISVPCVGLLRCSQDFQELLGKLAPTSSKGGTHSHLAVAVGVSGRSMRLGRRHSRHCCGIRSLVGGQVATHAPARRMHQMSYALCGEKWTLGNCQVVTLQSSRGVCRVRDGHCGTNGAFRRFEMAS